MKAKNTTRLNALAALAALLLAAVNWALAASPDREGGGSVIRGVDRGGITFGVINAIAGSAISVNGTTFEASAAAVTSGGEPANLGQLAPGQIVTVVGVNSGAESVATSVSFDASVVGPLTAVNLTSGELTTLGQNIIVDGSTLFGAAAGSLAGLSPGQPLAVSGYRDAAGAIRATRVDVAGSSATPAVIGTIAEVDAGVHALRIGELWVDYSGAVVTGFSGGVPAVGETALASGLVQNPHSSLLAQSLSRYVPVQLADGTSLSMEGLVSQVISAGRFALGGVTVHVSAQTEFEGGTAADIAVNRKLEVSGVLDVTGALFAERIELRPDGDLEFEAVLQAVSDEQQALQLLGLKLFADEQTVFEDDSEAHAQVMGLSHLSPGDYLEVDASIDHVHGWLKVAKLVRRAQPGNARVEGCLESLDAATRTAVVQGVNVTAEPGNPDMDDFFAHAIPGDRVKLEGDEDSFNHITARVLEIDNDAVQPEMLEIDGLVTGFVSPRLFFVGSFVVLANGQTLYQNGSAQDVAMNVAIEMKARPVDGNLLIASEIDFAVD